jgi:hypothetical protein
MFRSDQTRYHQEWVGFTKLISLPGNTGAVTAFDANDSLGFQARFQDWRGFRIIGWTCSIIPEKGYDTATGITAHAPFNQSSFGALSLAAPLNINSLLELPNCKTISISDSNPRSKVNFQWFNRKGDINALPFQQLSIGAPIEFITGLLSFNSIPSAAIQYRAYGKFLIQFKDKNYFNTAVPPTISDECEYPESPTEPVVKRLGRNLTLHN